MSHRTENSSNQEKKQGCQRGYLAAEYVREGREQRLKCGAADEVSGSYPRCLDGCPVQRLSNNLYNLVSP
jgi:hypothetical protein